jgi:PD-(D/E)XK nuclease superfamily
MNRIRPTKEFIPDNIDYTKIYSPAKLKMFKRCPKEYEFSYLDPIYSKLKNKLKALSANIWKFQTVGKAVEKAITLFYYLPPEQRTQDALLLYLRSTWTSEAQWNKRPPLGVWGGFKTLDEERASYSEAQEMLRNFYKICEINPDIAFLPTNDFKKSIEDYKNLIMRLNDDYDISGKFDFIIKTPNGRLHIIDFKTGKSKEADNFQLRFYKVLAEEKFKIPVEKVSFYYLWTGSKVDFDLEGINTQDIKDEIIKQIDMIKSTTTFAPRPSKLCNYCVFKAFCPAKTEVQKILKDSFADEIPDDLPF